MLRPTPRRAFTLVELLVVIGLIATLMGLLLPAVNSAREGARRGRCAMNQTRLALAMAMYDSRNSSLPGWRNTLPTAGGPFQTTWIPVLLPFLERTDVHDAFINGNGGSPYLDFIWCPSNPSKNTDGTSYSANAAGASECGTSGSPSLFNRSDGAIGDNSSGTIMSLVDITNGDGLATTLLIGETIGSMNPRWLQPVFWPGESNTHAPALGFPIVGATTGFSSLTQTTSVINPPASGAFNTRTGLVPSSAHPGGAVVAFADGSSRFLKNDLRPWVFAHLFTSNSSWNSSGPANRKYSSNSLTANRFLLLSGSTSAYSLKVDDY